MKGESLDAWAEPAEQMAKFWKKYIKKNVILLKVS
jgi:hypothetical protein